MNSGITEKIFGNIEGREVMAYTLSNANGMQVTAINYGATIIGIITKDKAGTADNVILGFDSLEAYLQNGHQYIGAIVGRYCNRIANGRFSLDGRIYQLACNDNNNSLHGGYKGFDKVWWDIEKQDDLRRLKLTYLSKDGEEGYPGNLVIELTYTLTEDNRLIIDYTGHTDKPCPVNLTSHCYFNLSAGNEPLILDHELRIFANQYTVVNEESIPTGQLASVRNTPLDFNISKKIGRNIDDLPGGYDHNFILNEHGGKAAELYDPHSGRLLEMFTTEPGLQFYSGNFLDKTIAPAKYLKYAALCLEAQHFPNSPNEPAFPDTILRPGETYRQTTVYKFATK